MNKRHNLISPGYVDKRGSVIEFSSPGFEGPLPAGAGLKSHNIHFTPLPRGWETSGRPSHIHHCSLSTLDHQAESCSDQTGYRPESDPGHEGRCDERRVRERVPGSFRFSVDQETDPHLHHLQQGGAQFCCGRQSR